MYEIRFHGRGGQGAVLASKILAKALAEEGKFVKAIPSFGFERRGAPVEAYLRFDDKLIRQATNIYTPDCVICLDPTLPRSVNIFEQLKDGGVWVQVKPPVEKGSRCIKANTSLSDPATPALPRWMPSG